MTRCERLLKRGFESSSGKTPEFKRFATFFRNDLKKAFNRCTKGALLVKLNVIVGNGREEYECPIEEASFYDVTTSRYPSSPPDVTAYVLRAIASRDDLVSALRACAAYIAKHLKPLGPNPITKQAYLALEKAGGLEQ